MWTKDWVHPMRRSFEKTPGSERARAGFGAYAFYLAPILAREFTSEVPSRSNRAQPDRLATGAKNNGIDLRPKLPTYVIDLLLNSQSRTPVPTQVSDTRSQHIALVCLVGREAFRSHSRSAPPGCPNMACWMRGPRTDVSEI